MKLNLKYFREKMRKIAKSYNFLQVDFSFCFIFVVAILLDEVGLYLVFVLFGILHEFAHFFVAKKLGYYAKKIRLNFFGASLEGCDDFLIDDEIKIVLAGPIFNFFMVVFCYLSFWFYPESYTFLYDVLIANWSLFLFNFLPVFPLDFGRILLAVFTKKNTRVDALKSVKNVSLFFIFLLFCFFLVSSFFEFNFMLGFVCVNLVCLLFSSADQTSYKRSLFAERKMKKIAFGLIERRVCVKKDIPLFKLLKFVDDNHFVVFVVLDDEFCDVKTLTEIELFKTLGMI